jgi:hypothetical protein
VLRVQFHDHGDTRMTLHQGPFTPEFRDLTRAGWMHSNAVHSAIATSQLRVLPGQTHQVSNEAILPVAREFFA